MGHTAPSEPKTKLQIAKEVLFGIFVFILWLTINGLLWWTLDFARRNVKLVDDLP